MLSPRSFDVTEVVAEYNILPGGLQAVWRMFLIIACLSQ